MREPFNWERAISYIEVNLESHLTLHDVAQHCHYSSYHFSVSFHRYFGETMKSYIHKRRLTRAAEDLKQTNLPIIEVAIKYGYSSQEAFSRAFTTHFGITPRKYRVSNVPLQETCPKYRRYIDQKERVTVNDTILNLQDKLEAHYDVKILNILNGRCMLEKFQRDNLITPHATYTSFNEAMCWGETDVPIFSQSFTEKRVRALQTTEEAYREIVIEALQPLFEQKFDVIVLWFGDDMFCQMNLLTLVAYLAQIDYQGDVYFCMALESTDEMLDEAFEIDINGYLDVYQRVRCDHLQPDQALLPVTYQAVQRYLTYREKNSPIVTYINNHLHKADLVQDLLAHFPEYGLGDLQYQMMIEAVRSKG